MSRRNRILVALAVIALVSPLLPTVAAVHVLLDHDHEGDRHDPDPESGLHGHSHRSGTPSHEHGLSAPALGSSAVRHSAATVYVLRGHAGPAVTAIVRLDRASSCEAVARASPIQNRTSVLRI